MVIQEAKGIGQSTLTPDEMEMFRFALDVTLRKGSAKSEPETCNAGASPVSKTMTETSEDGEVIYTHYFTQDREIAMRTPCGNWSLYSRAIDCYSHGIHYYVGSEVTFKGTPLSPMFSPSNWDHLQRKGIGRTLELCTQ